MNHIKQIHPDDPLYEKTGQDIKRLKEYFQLNGYDPNDIQRICEATVFELLTFAIKRGYATPDDIIETLKLGCELKVNIIEQIKVQNG